MRHLRRLFWVLSTGIFLLNSCAPGPRPPIAVIQAEPLDGPAPLKVVFDGTRSRDPDGFITEFRWDFGDGQQAAGAAVTHTYRRPGEFSATLTVKDNQNLQAQAKRKISVAAPARGAPIALRRVTTPVGLGPQALALGDFNGDGRLDLVTANEDSNSLSVILMAGSGARRARPEIAVSQRPLGIAVGDFNRDENLDLAVSSWVENTVTLFVGNGQGEFSSERTIPVCRQPKDLFVADFNGDGYQDLTVLCSGANRLLVFFSDAQGGFGPGIPYEVGTRPLAMQLLDLNGDNNLDIAVANDSTISLLSNDGAGRFTMRVLDIPQAAFGLATADLNSDGRPDLLVAHEQALALTLLLSTDGDRYQQTEFSLEAPARSVAVGDLNGDGKTDLVVGGQLNDILIWRGNGLGEFGELQNFPGGGAPATVLIADLNGDAKLDIATANVNTASVTVFFNETIASSPLSARRPGEE